jgi:XTP/dITP diphosphohydrolase
MVYCATGNPGKLREFRLAAGQDGVQVETAPGFADLPPCAETGATFEANAILKAEYYGQLAPGLLFADDSGLEVDALGGAPGVYSARFAGPDATDGFGYDPLFYYPPFGCSFGDAAPERKLTVSHRGAALRALFHHLSIGRV